MADREQTLRSPDQWDQVCRALVEASPDGVTLCDPGGRILYASAKALSLFGCHSEEEALGKALVAWIDPQDRGKAAENLARILRSESVPGPNEYRMLKCDGTPFLALVSTSVVRDPDGTPRWIMATHRDITERKQPEETLRESEERSRVLLDESSDPIFSFYPEGRFRYVNRAFAEGAGLPPAAIIGKTIWDIFAKDEADTRYAAVKEVFSSGQEKVAEVRVPGPNGHRYYMTTAKPILDEGGRVLSVICVSKDITVRSRLELAIRENETLFRVLAETISAAVWVYQGAEVRYVNHAAECISGYSREDLLRMNFWDFVHPDYVGLIKERGFARQTGTPVPQRYEFKFITKAGEERWLDMSATAIEFNGKPAALGTGFDITERKRAEEERERLITELRQALAEVRTLSGLLPICANCKRIRDDKGYWTQVEAYLTRRTSVQFSHGICPDCFEALYPDPSLAER